MKKLLRMIKISDFKNIILGKVLIPRDEGYFTIYSPQTTILILDTDKKHIGSVYLKEEMKGGEE